MPLIGRFTKQPAEVLDYVVDFSDWMEGRADTATSHVVVAEPGITVVGSALSGNKVTIALSGGTDGQTYKVTVRLTTSTAMVREADFQIGIKDV